jgi:hypothetical protein
VRRPNPPLSCRNTPVFLSLLSLARKTSSVHLACALAAKLSEEKAALDEQVGVRERQFSLLMAAVDDLSRVLVEDPFVEPTSEAAGSSSGTREEGEEEEDDEGGSKRQKV